MSAFRKLQLLEFDSITCLMQLCFSTFTPLDCRSMWQCKTIRIFESSPSFTEKKTQQIVLLTFSVLQQRVTQCALGYHQPPPPPSKTPPLSFLPSLSPLKSENCPSALFQAIPLYILVFQDPPLKIRFFSESPILLTFFILNPILSFKVTKFLVKICQFKFLVLTEKHFCL